MAEIDGWHEKRNFKRRHAAAEPRYPHIGYHDVIDIDGNVIRGRDASEQGAHSYPHNTNSIGVCLLGTDAYTPQQWLALREYVANAKRRWPGLHVRGHRDINPHKTCPGFNVVKWVINGCKPMQGHIYRPGM